MLVFAQEVTIFHIFTALWINSIKLIKSFNYSLNCSYTKRLHTDVILYYSMKKSFKNYELKWSRD